MCGNGVAAVHSNCLYEQTNYNFYIILFNINVTKRKSFFNINSLLIIEYDPAVCISLTSYDVRLQVKHFASSFFKLLKMKQLLITHNTSAEEVYVVFSPSVIITNEVVLVLVTLSFLPEQWLAQVPYLGATSLYI